MSKSEEVRKEIEELQSRLQQLTQAKNQTELKIVQLSGKLQAYEEIEAEEEEKDEN